MRLYPQLLPRRARAVVEELAAAPCVDLEQRAALEHRWTIRSATGGTSVSVDQLKMLQKAIRGVASRHGYAYGDPGERTVLDAATKSSFDAELGKCLHRQMELAPTEAVRPGVWCFLGCVLAPELVRWRFPGEQTTSARFLGNRLRNMYGRVWWRGHLFHDPSREDPYWLLDALGEDELVQITERPNAAGNRALAVSLGRNLVERWQPEMPTNRPNLLREVMKRLLRLLPLIRFEALEDTEIDEAVTGICDETLIGLGVDVGVSAGLAQAWDEGRRWSSLPPDRRYALLLALTDEQVARLEPLLDRSVHARGEYEARWRALFQLDSTAGEVLRLVGSVAVEGAGDDLGPWLVDGEAGPWTTDGDPRRAQQFVSWLRQEDLESIYAAIGWEWPTTLTWSGAQRELRRRFNGTAAEIVAAIPDTGIERLLPWFGPEAEGARLETARRAMADWLVRGEGTWQEPEAEGPEDAALVEEGAPESAAVEPVPEGEPGWDDPLPEPPGLIRSVLQSAGVESNRDLLNLDLRVVRRMPGVGFKKVDAIREFRAEVEAWLRSSAVAAAEAPPSFELAADDDLEVRLEAPIPEPPGLIRNVLVNAGIETVGDLLRLDSGSLQRLPGVGRKKVDEIRAFQLEVASDLEVGLDSMQPENTEEFPLPAAMEFEGLQALDAWLFQQVEGREATAFSMRFEQGAKLQEIGDGLGVSRERARQILRKVREEIAASVQLEARRLLDEECQLSELDKAIVTGRSGLDDGHLSAVAWIATGEFWAQIAEGVLWRGTGGELTQLLRDLGRATDACAELPAAELGRVAGVVGVSPALAHVLLESMLGWRRERDVLVPADSSESIRDWLVSVLREHGAPAHQNDVAAWMMEREGVSAGSRFREQVSYVRRVEGMLSRHPEVFRYDRGTFVHVDNLNVTREHLDRVVDWCVGRLKGETGPWSTVVLLELLEEAGFDTGALNPYVLKNALILRPEILALRKTHVAYADSFHEDGVQLADRLAVLLSTVGGPLTLSEIMERFPEGVYYSPYSLRSALDSDPRFSGCEATGGFIRVGAS